MCGITLGGYWDMSTGYRKIPGNSCVGGISHETIRVPCPGSWFNFGSWGNILIILTLLGCAGLLFFNKDMVLEYIYINIQTY